MTAVMLELLRERSDRYHCIRLAAMVPGRGRSRPAAMLQANFRVRFVFVSVGRERSSCVIFVWNSLCYDSRFLLRRSFVEQSGISSLPWLTLCSLNNFLDMTLASF